MDQPKSTTVVCPWKRHFTPISFSLNNLCCCADKHQTKLDGTAPMAKMVRTSASDAGGFKFEARMSHTNNLKKC